MVKKILAVDDARGTQNFYRAVLEDAGFSVETAADVTAAIMLCEEFKPDLLVLDWEMPGGGGKMVFDKVCGLLGGRISVLFVTGAPGRVSVDTLISKEAVLKKPASVEALLSHIESLLVWSSVRPQ